MNILHFAMAFKFKGLVTPQNLIYLGFGKIIYKMLFPEINRYRKWLTGQARLK